MTPDAFDDSLTRMRVSNPGMQRAMNTAHNLAWCLWIGGTALIIGSWINVVPVKVGWVGFGVAVAGSLLSRHSHRFRSAPRATRPRILCDSCRLNTVHACWRPERPHATECPDYEALR